jgi:CheY-like chemotaxis protein
MAAQSTQIRRIVLVEDDDICSRQVASALRRSFTDLDVQQTKDADEALLLLADESSRLLITDAHSRQLDGIAVATCARERRPELPVIVLSNPPCAARRIPRLGEAAWLEKPPKTDRLVGLVERLLAAPTGFSGALTIEGLPDLVQLLSMTHASGALHVRCGQRRGCLWFDDGTIVDADIASLRGVAAVYEILSWRGGTFALDRAARATRYSIDLSVTQLLLECMCRQDHERFEAPALGPERPLSPIAAPARKDAGRHRTESQTRLRLPELPAEPPPPPPPAGWIDAAIDPRGRAAKSFQRGLELVREKEYEAARGEWERALELDPDNRSYQSNLRRLRELMSRNQTMRGQHGDQE